VASYFEQCIYIQYTIIIHGRNVYEYDDSKPRYFEYYAEVIDESAKEKNQFYCSINLAIHVEIKCCKIYIYTFYYNTYVIYITS